MSLHDSCPSIAKLSWAPHSRLYQSQREQPSVPRGFPNCKLAIELSIVYLDAGGWDMTDCRWDQSLSTK